MPRARKDRIGRRHLNDFAEIHYRHSVAESFNNGKIVRNENIGQIELRPEVSKQCQNLCLDRHIQRRDRFIKYNDFRACQQGSCNADALGLPTGKFMRKARKRFGWQFYSVNDSSQFSLSRASVKAS